jgi:WD40 repeat protein
MCCGFLAGLLLRNGRWWPPFCAAASVLVAAVSFVPAVLTHESRAAEPAESASPKLDLYGDPIPAGAAMRLGTIRFRGGDWHGHIAFRDDGSTLISTLQNKICFWETRNGKLLREIELPDQNVNALDVSPDGKIAALAANRLDSQRKDVFYSVTVLELESGKERAKIEWTRLQGSECRECRFTPDGATLVIAGSDGMFTLWDVAAQQELLKYKLPGGEVQAIDVSPDGQLIAATTRDGVYLWAWMAGDKPVKVPIGDSRVMAVRFSPSGKLLGIGGDGRIGAYLWDLKASKVVRTLRSEKGDSRFYTYGLAFTPDSKFLALPAERESFAPPAARERKAILFWDTESGEVVRRFDTGPFEHRGVLISRDGQWLAASGMEQKINVWNLRTGEEMGREAIGHEGSIHGVQFSPDGKNVVTASDDGTIRIWDATTGRQQKVLRHEYWVRGMAVSPDGKWIASNSLDKTVRLWDMATGKEVYRLPGHGRLGGRRPVAFTADSRSFCTWGDQDTFLRVWDVATGKAIREFTVRPSDVKPTSDGEETDPDPFGMRDWKNSLSGAEFSSDGRVFVLMGARAVYIFDVDSG